jgi:hypothetical protein
MVRASARTLSAPAAEVPLQISIPPPNLQTFEVEIRGTAPLMINKFSAKAKEQIAATQQLGSQGNKGRKREAKDFDAVFNGARHLSREGWDGIAAGSFRNGMISACRLVGFKMTLAKLSLFIEPDGWDAEDGTPLVRIIGGRPERSVMAARNATGVVDLRIRPQWPAGQWGAVLRVRYDADQFSATDVVNLLARVGAQGGIGEGRPDSKMSAGIGFGTFDLVPERLELAAD